MIDQEVLDLIETSDWVTFAELKNRFGGHFGGNLCLELPGNVVLWPGIKPEFCDVLDRLIKAKKIHYVPASYLTYFHDGAVPRMPIAKRPPKGGYKKPHWIPVCLRPGPYPVTKKSHKS